MREVSNTSTLRKRREVAPACQGKKWIFLDFLEKCGKMPHMELLPWLSIGISVLAASFAARAMLVSLPQRVFRELKDLHERVLSVERTTEAARVHIATIAEEIEEMIAVVEKKRRRADGLVARQKALEERQKENGAPQSLEDLQRLALQRGLLG